MIAGIFHQGSGLGNQLFRYVTSRVLAEDKGFNHSMLNASLFKGDSFIHIKPEEADKTFTADLSTSPVSFKIGWNYFTEKRIVENGVDIRGYDPEINFVQDNTIIDGEFQDQRYWGHRMDDIDKWLHVEPIDIPDDVCLIGFRGGEYAMFPDLFLTREYWDEAIKLSGHTKFEVHTDDYSLAKEFFPDYPVVADMKTNWRAMRYAKAAIVANSSFYIFPRLLSKGLTIAPRYWARRNTKTWALPQNYYPEFTYL